MLVLPDASAAFTVPFQVLFTVTEAEPVSAVTFPFQTPPFATVRTADAESLVTRFPFHVPAIVPVPAVPAPERRVAGPGAAGHGTEGRCRAVCRREVPVPDTADRGREGCGGSARLSVSGPGTEVRDRERAVCHARGFLRGKDRVLETPAGSNRDVSRCSACHGDAAILRAGPGDGDRARGGPRAVRREEAGHHTVIRDRECRAA